MTKEKIIDMIDKTQGFYEVFRKRGVYIIEENKIDEFADELLALIEKEKKEQAREILQDLKDMMIIPEFTLHLILNTLSQKYGVRL